MADLRDKMRDLIRKLRTEGFLDLRWPEIEPECEDDWTPDYAICYRAYPDDVFLGDYFDRDEYDYKFKGFLEAHFCAGEPGVTVKFRDRSQEIEVQRKAA